MADTADLVPSHLNMPRRHAKKPAVVPVGLNFGPTEVLIAFFIDQDEYYTGVPCVEVYKTFFRDALSQEVQCNYHPHNSKGLFTSAVSSFLSSDDTTELVETMSRDIKNAISRGISALDRNPALDFKLIAVTVPDNWGTSARTHVATAAKLAGHPLDGSHMIIPYSRAIQLALKMSQHTEGRYKTLLLDYNKSYLHLMLVEMCGTECVMKGQVYFPHLGEDELHEAPVLGSAVVSDHGSATHNVVARARSDGMKGDDEYTGNSFTSDSSNSDLIFPINDVDACNLPTRTIPPSNQSIAEHPTTKEKTNDSTAMPDEFFKTSPPTCHNQAAHFAPIIHVTRNFLAQMKRARHLEHTLHDLKYIVIDGEATIPGLWDLRDAVMSEFADKEQWIEVEGDKRDCGAYGAAVMARQQVQNPKRVGDWKDLPGYVPGRQLG